MKLYGVKKLKSNYLHLSKSNYFLIIIVFLLSLPTLVKTETDVSYPYVGIIKKNKVNLRCGPSTNYASLLQLNKEEKVIIWDKSKDWYKIEPPSDARFWIHNTLIDGNIVKSYSVNVRSKPNIDSTVICQVEKGDQVKIDTITGEWTSVFAPANAYVWVHRSLVELHMSYDKYIQKQTKEKKGKEIKSKLNQLVKEAEEFDRKQMYLTDEEINYEMMKEKYMQIIDFAPSSSEAITALERIEVINKKEEEVTAKVEEKRKQQKQKQILEQELENKDAQIEKLINEKTKKKKKGFSSSGLFRYDGSKTRLK